MARRPELEIYRSCSVVGDATFEGDTGRTLTEAFVGAIADAEGIAPTDVPPLYGSVDFDALARLVETTGETADSDLLIAFRIDRWNVFVNGEGLIRVCDATIEIEPEAIFEGYIA
ncbi:HalOD1 output domain-containing protein [Halorubrum ejinorense]|uniref:HalOD1 output domain-containing protein n=1 Tax=Halorubrum ejinorense TaxID=425309 RepID=A0ABV4IKL6_9EURY